jgi:NAD(P)-dependent dehydrogenase (short-subunit alcohol dehydrogenase family)
MTAQTILLAGASRGLGLGLAQEYLGRGWQVIATARDPAAPGLSALKAAHPDALTVETLDIADPASVTALATRLAARTLDVLFVVAGISGNSDAPIHAVGQDAVAHEFVTNATAPLCLAEALAPSLAPKAAVVFMTSILGSIASNAGGGMELYRATKAALNMLASCYALRHRATPVLLLHPGWVRTALGGHRAPVDVETSVRGLADVIAAHGAKPGIAYLDYQGTRLPW